MDSDHVPHVADPDDVLREELPHTTYQKQQPHSELFRNSENPIKSPLKKPQMSTKPGAFLTL
jgi:hypothetical protein